MNKFIKKITDLDSRLYYPFKKMPDDRTKYEVYAHFIWVMLKWTALAGGLIWFLYIVFVKKIPIFSSLME